MNAISSTLSPRASNILLEERKPLQSKCSLQYLWEWKPPVCIDIIDIHTTCNITELQQNQASERDHSFLVM